MKLRLLTPIFLILINFQLAAQESETIMIKGTSSLHDWESDVTEFVLTADLNLDRQQGTVNLVIPVTSIKSGKSIMDDKTYDALKFDKNPEIIFNGNDITLNGDKISVAGNLTIAGKTNPATIEGTFKKTANNLNVTGIYSLKMTDFDIDPPTAMFGTLTTGDDITIEFNVNITL